MIVAPIFAATLERELAEKDAKIAEQAAQIVEIREQYTLNLEGVRDAAMADARKGVHELHSPEGELIAKFRWEEESGDPDVGMPGWACWIVTNDSPPVVPLEEAKALADALESLRDEQNGPQLERHKERWRAAYDQANKILTEFTTKHPQP